MLYIEAILLSPLCECKDCELGGGVVAGGKDVVSFSRMDKVYFHSKSNKMQQLLKFILFLG
jgi:hypothetical protein